MGRGRMKSWNVLLFFPDDSAIAGFRWLSSVVETLIAFNPSGRPSLSAAGLRRTRVLRHGGACMNNNADRNTDQIRNGSPPKQTRYGGRHDPAEFGSVIVTMFTSQIVVP